MKTEIELIKAEVRKDDQGGETTHLWFEATIDDERYGDQIVLCDPSSFTNSMWQGIGKCISDHWEEFENER